MRKYLCMSSKKKLRSKLEAFASDKNWTFAEAEQILLQHGFNHAGGSGSHRVWSHPDLDQPVVLAEHGKSIKPGYIRAIRQAIHELPK